MRIFLSAGEPSGDLHGANLVRALQRLDGTVATTGFGGERMQAAGCELLYPLAQQPLMGFLNIIQHVPHLVRLLGRADRLFREAPPDAVVLIDNPGFNWWVARRAHARGIPVIYFVPPQLWAWAGWRVKKMRRWVDEALCSLPFEEPWFRERGVPAHYVGHPYFDELPAQRLDQEFLAQQRARCGRLIGLLPGSRTHEVRDNLKTLVRAAGRIQATCPDTRFLVACFRPAHKELAERYLVGRQLPFIDVCVGRTAEIIELAHACVAVSGSVSLELLYRCKPTVVTYRAPSFYLWLARYVFMKCRYISLVNLLAGKELFPEFLSDRCEARGVSDRVLTWLTDPRAYNDVCGELRALKEKAAAPDACEKAARFILAKTAIKSTQKAPRAA